MIPINKRQLEVEKAKLAAEKAELKHLKGIYKKASDDISEKIRISNGKINVLLKDFDKLDETQRSILQSQIYQRNFQQSLKKQIDAFTKELESKQYESVNAYLKNCYTTGFTGTLYDLAGQGVPFVFPIDQKKVTKAMVHDTKLSKPLYNRLGEDVNLLKKRIANNISRGIATADSYVNIARNIANGTKISINNTMRIARTEGHRIQCAAAYDVQHEAQEAGADIVKQWDATLDGHTRETHAMCDGEIVELDETFSNGLEYPGDPAGDAEEVINCRCALLQRAKWALDDDELQMLKDRAEYFGLNKEGNFSSFREKYLNTANRDVVGVHKATKAFTPAKTIEEAEEYAQQFIGNGYSKTFKNKAVYKGISLDNANEINRALSDLYSMLEMPTINGIKTISPNSALGKKIFSSADAVAAYNPVERGIFINKDILKNLKTLEAYNLKSDDAWRVVMSNIDKLNGKQKELAILYRNSGRSLVGNGSVHDYIVHEMGHHVQWNVLDPKTNNLVGDNMSRYAKKVSGYANSSKGEYIAESFAAYVKGETDILDPKLVNYLNNYSKTGKLASSPQNGKIELVRKGTGSLPTVFIKDKKEYAMVQHYLNEYITLGGHTNERIIRKEIGDYVYTVENNGFGEYRVIGRIPINSKIK